MSKNVVLIDIKLNEENNEVTIVSEANTEVRADFLEGALAKFFNMYPDLLDRVVTKMAQDLKGELDG